MGLRKLADKEKVSNNHTNRQYKRCLGCYDNPLCEERLPLHSKDNRCPKCKREFNKNRDSRYRKIKDFYGSIDWKNKRNQIREESFYLCEICAAKGKLSDSTDVHHIKSIWQSENWELRLEDSNLIGLCSRCHSLVHNGDIELDAESFIEDGIEIRLCKSLDEVYERILPPRG